MGEAAPEVTERDLKVLLDVYKHRYLSVSQIHRLHFPSLQTAYRRLRALKTLGLLHGFIVPGFPEHVYYLSSDGAGQVASALGTTVESLKWTEHSRSPKDYYFLRHFLKINDFRIALGKTAPESGLSVIGFIPEYFGQHRPGGGVSKYIRDVVCDVVQREDLGHTPDAVFALEKNGKPALFFLEVDRGTEVVSDPGKGVLKACRFYLNYLLGGQYQRYSQDFRCSEFKGFRALFVTTSEQRLANMRQAVSNCEFDERAKRFLWFATEQRTIGPELLQLIWVSGVAWDTTLYRIG